MVIYKILNFDLYLFIMNAKFVININFIRNLDLTFINSLFIAKDKCFIFKYVNPHFNNSIINLRFDYYLSIKQKNFIFINFWYYYNLNNKNFILYLDLSKMAIKLN